MIQVSNVIQRYTAAVPNFIEEDQANGVFNLVDQFAVKIIDMREQALAHAITSAAIQEGFNEVWLLDKKFVLDALKEKLEREGYLR